MKLEMKLDRFTKRLTQMCASRSDSSEYVIMFMFLAVLDFEFCCFTVNIVNSTFAHSSL